MAKKTTAKNAAELDRELREDQNADDEQVSLADAERETRRSLAKAMKEEDLHLVRIPTKDDGNPVELRLNGKVYSGEVKVPLSIALQLREMGEAVVRRERAIHVGQKYQGNGSGIGGIRRVGIV